MRKKNYKAFISYSHHDRNWAKWIRNALEAYRVPRHLVGEETSAGKVPARLRPVFRDREELPSAPDLTERIRDALEASENLVVVCSPNSAKSTYVDAEIRMFREIGRGDRVFCIIVDGDPGDVDGEGNCFCPALREQEPIAADARESGDGKSLARLKIIAGMLGLGLDDLRQREMHRRHRRMAYITISSLAALAVTAVLAINAVIARDIAEQRRHQAEDLLSFMVGDLYERLEPIGRLDVLDDVGAKAMLYYATVKASELTDTELLHHAQVLTQIGEIRLSQHQFDTALDSFLEAFNRSDAHYESDPGDDERLYNRGQAEFWVGYVHWRRGALDEAKAWLTRYLKSSESVAKMVPANRDYALEVVYGHHNLAVLALEAGNLDDAEAEFQGEVRSMRDIVRTEPSATNRRDLADAISWLGNIHLERGELERAVTQYDEAITIFSALLDGGSDNAAYRHELTHVRQKASNALMLSGELDLAASYNDTAIETLEALTSHDPGNVEWQRSLANATLERAHIQFERGEHDTARSNVETAIGLYASADSGDDDVFFRTQMSDARLLLARLQLVSGEVESASESAAAALQEIEIVAEGDRLNHRRLALLVSIYTVSGIVKARQGFDNEAQVAWTRAAELLRGKAASSASPFIDRARAELASVRS